MLYLYKILNYLKGSRNESNAKQNKIMTLKQKGGFV